MQYSFGIIMIIRFNITPYLRQIQKAVVKHKENFELIKKIP